MKKLFRAIATVACMACMVTMTSGCSTMFFQKSDGVEISGTPVDNDFNNYVEGANLVRIDDKLYFNYPKSESTFGVVEISEAGAKPIVSREPFSLYLYPVDNYVMKYDDQLLVYRFTDDPPQHYSFQTNCLEPFEEIDGVRLETGQFQQVGDFIVQQIDNEETKELRWNFNGEQGSLAQDQDVYTFCVLEDCVYYVVYTDKDPYMGGSHHQALYRFDYKTKTNELILKPEHSAYIRLRLCGDFLIISTEDARIDQQTTLLQKIDLHSDSKDIETICFYKEDVSLCNAYGQLLYFQYRDDRDREDCIIETYNIDTGERKVLLEGLEFFCRCYIFDDTWVYLIESNDLYLNKLYRIKQDGTCFEKVYG